MSEFKPPTPIAEFLDAQKTSTVNARFGNLAQGSLQVRTIGKGKYRIKKQPLPLTHPAFSLVEQFAPGFTPALIIGVDDSKVIGEVALAAGEKVEGIAHRIQKTPEMLGLSGFAIGTLPTITNTIQGGSLHFGLKGVRLSLGSAFTGKFNLDVFDTTVSFDGSVPVGVKGLGNGNLDLKRAPSGLITGRVAVALSSTSVSGNVDVAWDGVSMTGLGKVPYKGEKFSGEVSLFMMEKKQAEQLAKAKQPPSAAPVPAAQPSNKAPAHIEYVIFGEGNLGFSFTQWLNGTAQVIIDAKGNLTVISELRPQKEFNLFHPPQKDYVKELFKFEIHATYGLPPIADVFIFASIGMDLFAKLGPARIYDIVIIGDYSTDPTVAKKFSIGGKLNLSAAAGVRLRIEAGAGLEILGHDIKAGAGINGIAGIKAYAQAEPVVGYREKAVEGQDLKGEWFISGTLEIAAQPFLGLGGDLFVELETPWWSPLSDDKWTWPLFNKEWPLGGVIGMQVSVEHVFGSGELPKFDLKPLKEFNGENCVTELYKDNAKAGPGKELDQKGQWGEKNTPAANPPPKTPQPGNLKPGKPPSLPKAKPKQVAKTKGKPATPDARTKGGKPVKQLKAEAEKKGKGPKGKDLGKDGKSDATTKKADGSTSQEKKGKLHEALMEAQRVARKRGTTREMVDRALPEIAKRFGLSSLRTVDHGEESYRIHGELNPKEDSEDLPNLLDVARAVAKIGRDLKARKTQFDVRVATLDDARAVIAKALPKAIEMASPTPGSGYNSEVDQKNMEAFRKFRKEGLAFHVDVQRYQVSEIRERLKQEIGTVTTARDRALTEVKYHRDNPEWSARNQDSLRKSEQNLEAHKQRLGNLQEISDNLSQHLEDWKRLEKEGVLYGHKTVKADESLHRTVPHVNVQGVTQVTTRTETLELSIKLTIYVKGQ